MRVPRHRFWILAGLVCVLAVLSGCVTAEVKSASEALEAARSAGKDKECPSEFATAEDLVLRAKLLCNQCKPSEANTLAADAMGKIQGLCPAKAVAAPPPAPEPPPPPPAPAPTISISANPSSIDQGACSNLTWSATNATSVSIDPEVGSVGTSGSRQVCPTSTTRYTLNANGAGGSRSDSTMVSVKRRRSRPTSSRSTSTSTRPSPPFGRRTCAELHKLEQFVRKYQNCRFEVDGYTDSRGSETYNQGLSERRAEAVKSLHHLGAAPVPTGSRPRATASLIPSGTTRRRRAAPRIAGPRSWSSASRVRRPLGPALLEGDAGPVFPRLNPSRVCRWPLACATFRAPFGPFV